MKKTLFVAIIVAVSVLTACSAGKKIEEWETFPWDLFGLPNVEQPRDYVEFFGFYPDGKNDEGVYFGFETENEKPSLKYMEKYVDKLIEHADQAYNIGDYEGYYQDLTLEDLPQYTIDGKESVYTIVSDPNPSGFRYDIIFSKDGRYFKFGGFVNLNPGNSYAKAKTSFSVIPLDL